MLKSIQGTSKKNFDRKVSRQDCTETFSVLCCFIDSAVLKEKEACKKYAFKIIISKFCMS